MNAKPRNTPIPATSTPALHDRDFYTWATETAQAIREGSFNVVDWESVAEEVEDMGAERAARTGKQVGCVAGASVEMVAQTRIGGVQELGPDDRGATSQDKAALEAKSRFETDVGRDPCGGLRRREAPSGS
jgi:hypothetical protein